MRFLKWNQRGKSLNIVVLSAAPFSSATRSIMEAGSLRSHKMVVLDPKYLYLIVSNNEKGYDQIFDGYNRLKKPVRIKAKDVDAVISRIGKNLFYGTSVLHHFRYNLGIFTTQTPQGLKIASDKLLSLQCISTAKIRVPKTVIADDSVHIEWLIEQVGGLPAVCKVLRGSQGVGVMILESKLQTNTTLQTFYKQRTKLLLQEFIDSDARDVRAIVIGGEVVVAMERTAPDGDLRANVSLGGSGKKIILSEEDKDICVRASEACGLKVSGVDLLKDKDGNSFVIEVNGNYGYRIEKITNVNISVPLIMFCEANYNKEIKNNVFPNNKKKVTNISWKKTNEGKLSSPDSFKELVNMSDDDFWQAMP